jgi:Actinobacteria/chloroflexi VLRF1 release factor
VQRHGLLSAEPDGDLVRLVGEDGSTARLRPLVPLDAGPPGAEAAPVLGRFLDHVEAAPPSPLVLLLVRRGGYGVGVVHDGRLTASKVGTRYVQSRTAAGGWSQHRFARRRDNQAAALLDTVVAVTARLALGEDGRTAPDGVLVVTGGDRGLSDELLGDPRLAALARARSSRHLDVPDPRDEVLRRAVDQALAVQVEVVNA